jgi:ArsR family transcriptional regulator, arsenate/arsenite/antimonite-responsive transcriptional repressor
MQSRSATAALDLLFRGVADPTRLRLLNLIADREICVCYLVEILRMSQPKVSRHLAYLRRAGIVASRREGKWMHYRLRMPDNEAAAAILREVLLRLQAMPAMRKDVSRLTSACCAPRRFEVPAAAPAPVLAPVSGVRDGAETVATSPESRTRTARALEVPCAGRSLKAVSLKPLLRR